MWKQGLQGCKIKQDLSVSIKEGTKVVGEATVPTLSTEALSIKSFLSLRI